MGRAQAVTYVYGNNEKLARDTGIEHLCVHHPTRPVATERSHVGSCSGVIRKHT